MREGGGVSESMISVHHNIGYHAIALLILEIITYISTSTVLATRERSIRIRRGIKTAELTLTWNHYQDRSKSPDQIPKTFPPIIPPNPHRHHHIIQLHIGGGGV